MQTDYFTGPTVVHCHRLMHEDHGMMVTVNFTGVEGTRYAPAYGNMTTKSLIDPTCYKSSKNVKPAIFTGTRVGKCSGNECSGNECKSRCSKSYKKCKKACKNKACREECRQDKKKCKKCKKTCQKCKTCQKEKCKACQKCRACQKTS